ncbi:MAG: hypothetical protein JO151_18660 [Verrucomicrobia bacterium]|nr:hypothetical protein [Verrucomicrobiota bacterium]
MQISREDRQTEREVKLVIGQFDMVTDPGPLASFPSNPAANFASGKYTAITLTEDVRICWESVVIFKKSMRMPDEEVRRPQERSDK